jgi:hypothetical protein
VRIRILREDGGVRGPHCLLAFVSLAIDSIAARSFKDTVGRHHRHQRINIVTIPSVSERLQETFVASVCELASHGSASGGKADRSDAMTGRDADQ